MPAEFRTTDTSELEPGEGGHGVRMGQQVSLFSSTTTIGNTYIDIVGITQYVSCEPKVGTSMRQDISVIGEVGRESGRRDRSKALPIKTNACAWRKSRPSFLAVCDSSF